eukprot:TRINITY_DN592_c0_g1_i7.p3 TRINITY_DN592_c0_g1~~TRINITY_DN592_c0_g1_i7.p3  ORF type:complete len:130 (+),score=15.32 TRINITY_DN592_c0_g1_i7:205-594(+)
MIPTIEVAGTRLPVQYKLNEMEEPMRREIETQVQEAMREVTNNDKVRVQTKRQDIAHTIKSAMDDKYGPTWHVVVGISKFTNFIGRNFAGYMTYEANHMVYFYVGQKGFLVFKTVCCILIDIALSLIHI